MFMMFKKTFTKIVKLKAPGSGVQILGWGKYDHIIGVVTWGAGEAGGGGVACQGFL